MTLYEQQAVAKLREEILRSDIYIRDKGICWVCHEKVEFKDYDLGHLVDKCLGGQTTSDNTAVMHHKCNISKPRHSTLDEAVRWRNSLGIPESQPVVPAIIRRSEAIREPRLQQSKRQPRTSRSLLDHFGKRNRLPPYISYSAFCRGLAILPEPLPDCIVQGQTWQPTLGISLETQLISGLHYLGLIDQNNQPTLTMQRLLTHDETERRQTLKGLVTDRFAFVPESLFDKQATYQELDGVFCNTFPTLTPDLARKCIKFFVQLCEEAGITLSRLITIRMRNRHNTETNAIEAKPIQSDVLPCRTEQVSDGDIAPNSQLVLLAESLGIPFRNLEPLIPCRKKQQHNNSPRTLAMRAAKLRENLAKITPLTVTWIQGRPDGGPMWRVLPPPYKQEDMFTMRTTPPGAAAREGNGPYETLQVIGGVLSEAITFDVGYSRFTISPLPDGKVNIQAGHAPDKSNTGTYFDTVGTGYGQLSIKAWRQAKAKGMTFADFRRMAREHTPASRTN